MIFSAITKKLMPDVQHYSTIVLKKTGFDLLKEARENEQAVQPFTQTPSIGQPGSKQTTVLCADDLFFLFTAEIIMKKTVFTR
jgi:hypothetical protein